MDATKWDGAAANQPDSSNRELAISLWKSMEVYEPQILERLVAMTYSLLGAEELWTARIYSSLFWVLGGIPLFLLARNTTSFQGGILALAFYLFLPLGVLASRSFQPDPLMVLLVLWSAYSAYRWTSEKTWTWAIVSGILSGLAVLIKASAVFQVGFLLVFLVLVSWGIKHAIRQAQVWMVAGISISIPLAFYILQRGDNSSGYLGFWSSSFTWMLLDPGFYIRWLVFLEKNVVEISLFFVGLAGATLFDKRGKAIALGLWIGYGISGLVVPYLISSHNYYSLPLIPAVAFSLAPFASPILQVVYKQSKLWQGVFYAVLVIALAFSAWITRSILVGADFRQEVLGWQTMGRELPQNSPIIAITHDYGNRLRYYGWTAVSLWPTSADLEMASLRSNDPDDSQVMISQLAKGYGYFLVTLPKELKAQPQLAKILYNNYKLLNDKNGFLLFDLSP